MSRFLPFLLLMACLPARATTTTISDLVIPNGGTLTVSPGGSVLNNGYQSGFGVSSLGSAPAHFVFAGPGSGAPQDTATFRALVPTDIPALSYSSLTGRPTLGPLSSITPTGSGTSTAFLHWTGTAYSWASPVGTSYTFSTGLTNTSSTVTVNYGTTSGTALQGSLFGANSGVATLDNTGKLTSSQIPASLAGAISYQGIWNATTNTPTLANGTGTASHFYIVGTAGTTSLDGHASWSVGDWAIFNGTTWDRVASGSADVISVAGRTGIVTLSTSDISGLPAFPTGAIVGTTDTQTLTNKSIDASEITTGTLTPSVLGAGTADDTTYLRGDNTWQTITTSVQTVAGRTGNVVLTSSDIGGLAASATVNTQNAANITSGLLLNARMGSGTANSTTVLYGDHMWRTIATAGSISVGTNAAPVLALDTNSILDFVVPPNTPNGVIVAGSDGSINDDSSTIWFYTSSTNGYQASGSAGFYSRGTGNIAVTGGGFIGNTQTNNSGGIFDNNIATNSILMVGTNQVFTAATPINMQAAFYGSANSHASSFTATIGLNVFTGSTAAQTITLPAPGAQVSGIFVKNRSSVSVTVASASGSQIYTSSAQSSVTLAAGNSLTLISDGTFWCQ